MKIIQELSDKMLEELNDSCHYVKDALRYKGEKPALAQTFYNLAVDEMRHFDLLHDETVKIINEYKAAGEVVPEKMQAVYDYLHDKYIEKSHNIRLYMDQYKG